MIRSSVSAESSGARRRRLRVARPNKLCRFEFCWFGRECLKTSAPRAHGQAVTGRVVRLAWPCHPFRRTLQGGKLNQAHEVSKSMSYFSIFFGVLALEAVAFFVLRRGRRSVSRLLQWHTEIGPAPSMKEIGPRAFASLEEDVPGVRAEPRRRGRRIRRGRRRARLGRMTAEQRYD